MRLGLYLAPPKPSNILANYTNTKIRGNNWLNLII